MTEWKAVNLADVEKQLADEKYLNKSACGCAIPIHTFRIPGDYIEGRLRTCPNHDRKDRAECVHLFFPTASGAEVGVAIRCSKMIWDAITKSRPVLWGMWIRITYRGSIATTFGHAKKIYLVEYDKGCITEDFRTSEINAGKSQKPRPRRKIRRPAGTGIKK